MASLGTSIFNAMIAIGIIFIPGFARLARASTMDVLRQQYIDAARAIGMSDLRIILREILPNILAPSLVEAAVAFAYAVLLESALSFLGLGAQPPEPSWGNMINTGRGFMAQAPWLGIVPGTGAFPLRPRLQSPRRRIARSPRSASRGLTMDRQLRRSRSTTSPLCFPDAAGRGRVVDRVDLAIDEGEIVSVIGEFGSGKTMMALAVLGLLPGQARVAGGSDRLGGKSLLDLAPGERRNILGTDIAFIPQDAMRALNPTITVADQVGEPFVIHRVDRLGLRAPPRQSSCCAPFISPIPSSGAGTIPMNFPAACSSAR